jgi:cell division protein FtsI (penicillin-binding protein 3)
MEMVVTEGTAKRAFKDMPFAVAGKTGTAHVSDGPIKYGHGVYQATFVGYFPADKPQFTCIVVIRTKPHAASHFGGTLAAPVFREIATKLHAMYVDRKDPSLLAATKDTAAFYYAGYADDIKKVYSSMNIRYADESGANKWVMVRSAGYQPELTGTTIRNQVMPNVRGMGLKDALFLLENLGLKVSVKGKGKIANQSIAPGTALKNGITVVLELG